MPTDAPGARSARAGVVLLLNDGIAGRRDHRYGDVPQVSALRSKLAGEVVTEPEQAPNGRVAGSRSNVETLRIASVRVGSSRRLTWSGVSRTSAW